MVDFPLNNLLNQITQLELIQQNHFNELQLQQTRIDELQNRVDKIDEGIHSLKLSISEFQQNKISFLKDFDELTASKSLELKELLKRSVYLEQETKKTFICAIIIASLVTAIFLTFLTLSFVTNVTYFIAIPFGLISVISWYIVYQAHLNRQNSQQLILDVQNAFDNFIKNRTLHRAEMEKKLDIQYT
jgi:hypothetical protein